MAEAFFLAGLAANACVQAQGVVISSEDSLFPKANLQNGKPWEPFRFGSLDVNPKIEFDNNLIVNPSFEVDLEGASPATGWKIPTGGGTPDVSTAATGEPDGTKSLRLNANNEAAYQDRIVRPGGTYRHACYLHGDGTNITSAYVLDLLSGKWWTGSVWSTTKTAWATEQSAAFVSKATTFTLDAPLSGHVGPGKVRSLFERPASITAAGYVDAVYLWPKVTFAALIFHTIPTAFTIAVESADNAAFSTNLNSHGNLPARRFRTYLTFNGPATPQRFWRFLVTGTVYDGFKPWVGQPVLGERRVFLTNQRYGLVTAREMPKAGTPKLPSSLADAQQYRFEMQWNSSYSNYQQVAEEMLGVSFFGDEPIVIVPEVTRPEIVHGRGTGPAGIAPRWVLSDFLEYELSIQDDPFPVVTK